jgi:DNA-directed RNA polymerase beta subunit/DNA-directed RNA polymerase beta' subunit
MNDLPASPHIDSYQRFIDSLNEKLRTGLEEMLRDLKKENVIDFDPSVTFGITVSQKPDFKFPTPEEEEDCLRLNRTLALTIPIRFCLKTDGNYKETKVGDLPLITERGSFIHGGLERCIVGHFAYSPGVFFKRYFQGITEIREVRISPENGTHLKIRHRGTSKNRETEVEFSGKKKAPLHLFIKTLFKGQDLEEVNREGTGIIAPLQKPGRQKGSKPRQDVEALIAQCLGLGKELRSLSISEIDKQKIRELVLTRLCQGTWGELGKQQLLRRANVRDSKFMKSGTEITIQDFKLILYLFFDFCRDKIDEDDPWDLGNLKLRLVGDQLNDALKYWLHWIKDTLRTHYKNTEKTLSDNGVQNLIVTANGAKSAQSLFTKAIHGKIFRTPLCQIIPRQLTNLLEAATLTRRVRLSAREITGIEIEPQFRKPRQFHWSHIGRLCPLDTPLSEDIGTTLSLTVGARVNALGIVETACYPVSHNNGTIVISEEIEWVSPWKETHSGKQMTIGNKNKVIWIAFPDQKEKLRSEGFVSAHSGNKRLERVLAEDIAYIHVSEEGLFSLAANMIPFRKHDDPGRGIMACSMMRQALPLVNGESPRDAIGTGYEKRIPEKYPFRYGKKDDRECMAFGAHLVVGYLPWKGWNFEDAIVISRSASEKLTHEILQRFDEVVLTRTIDQQQKLYQKVRLRNTIFREDFEQKTFDDRGIIREKEEVEPGDTLVFEPSTDGKLFKRHLAPDGIRGTVTKVEILSTKTDMARIRFTIINSSHTFVGDKLANRHGHKGVVSLILENHDMPYFLTNSEGEQTPPCECEEKQYHCHMEMLINPLGVISRMNIGQLYETVQARTGTLKELPQKCQSWDPEYSDGDKLRDLGEVFVGEQYIMKLDHNAAEKLHSRSREPYVYTSFEQQPLPHKRLKGGQRVGEMEVWALMAHSAPALLQEMMTLKSDNPDERKILFHKMIRGETVAFSRRVLPETQKDTNEANKEKENTSKPEDSLAASVPEAFRTMASCCTGIGLSLKLVCRDNGKEKLVDPIPLEHSCCADDVLGVEIDILDQESFEQHYPGGEVKTTILTGALEETKTDNKNKYHSKGLESEQIFGPVESYTCACRRYRRGRDTSEKNSQNTNGIEKVAEPEDNRKIQCEDCGTPLISSRYRRVRFGHIKLARPVPNPLFFTYASDEVAKKLGIRTRCLSVLLNDNFGDERQAPLEFNDVKSLGRFLLLALKEPTKFQEGFQVKYPTLLPIQATNIEEAEELGLKILKGSSRSDLNKMYPASSLGEIIRKNDISGVEFISDMLRADDTIKNLSLDIIPVIPPTLRKRFRIGRNQESENDLTILYQEVIRKNIKLADAITELESESDLAAMEEKKSNYRSSIRALYIAIAQLFCNEDLPAEKRRLHWHSPGRPVFQSLSCHIHGKDGLIVGHLLGKRVDFSGRAVIVPDPTLGIDECRIPFSLAIELYFPLLISELRKKNLEYYNVTESDKYYLKFFWKTDEEAKRKVEESLTKLFNTYHVVLNRQPTLHRLGLLAFKPKLAEEGKSCISISPLVTAGFNADFDGDQMALYVPLTESAREELNALLPSNNLWHPADGRYALSLAQDIALGEYVTSAEPKKTKKDIYKKIEEYNAEDLVSHEETRARNAFLAATTSKISFSLKDMEDLSSRYLIKINSDVIDHKVCMDEIFEANPLPFRDIVFSQSRGNPVTMWYLAGKIFEREQSNLTNGLESGEYLSQAEYGRANNVETKLGTAEGGWLTKNLVKFGHPIKILDEDCEKKERQPLAVLCEVKSGNGFNFTFKKPDVTQTDWLKKMLDFRLNKNGIEVKKILYNVNGKIVAEDCHAKCMPVKLWKRLWFSASYYKIVMNEQPSALLCYKENNESIESVTIEDPEKLQGDSLKEMLTKSLHEDKIEVTGIRYNVSPEPVICPILDYNLFKEEPKDLLFHAKFDEKQFSFIVDDPVMMQKDYLEEMLKFSLDKNKIYVAKIGYHCVREEADKIPVERLEQRLIGRVLAKDFDEESHKNDIIDSSKAKTIASAIKIAPDSVTAFMKSPVTCTSTIGICRKCYGIPSSAIRRDGKTLIPLHANVGIIAAQALGEPVTQEALKAKHRAGRQSSEEKDQSIIKEIQNCFKKSPSLFSTSFLDDVEEFLDAVDGICRIEGINLPSVHIEVLLRGMIQQKYGLYKSWLAAAAHPDYKDMKEGNTMHVLCRTALNRDERRDKMQGLKEFVTAGRRLTGGFAGENS